MNFFEFNKLFSTEEKAIEYFIKVRYNDKKPICPICGEVHTVVREKGRPKFFHCYKCNSSFSVFKGTIFEKSDTDLRKWFYAINLFLNAKKGVSACQLQREIGVTYKTAWRILKQIRMAMGNEKMKEFINSVIEMDETYVGGKPRKGNRKKDNDKNNNGNDKTSPPITKRGRGTKKTPVIGTIDRDNKQVYCKVALSNKDGQALSGKQLLAVLEEVCKLENIIITDEFRGYNILDKNTKYAHFVVDHSCEYANGDIHTNNIEGFWGTLKRGIIGIYHKVSVKYLQNYVNEFCFRYNNRKSNMFDLVLRQAVLGLN